MQDNPEQEYDRDRLASDPEYRDKILDDIARRSRFSGPEKTFRWVLYGTAGLGCFLAGIIVGGQLGQQGSYYTVLTVVSFVLVPTVGLLIYYRRTK